MTRQLSTSLHKQGPGVRMSKSMDGSVYSSGKVSRMHETSTDHLREAWEVASQFLGSDRDVGLGKPKTINLRKPKTLHFIIWSIYFTNKLEFGKILECNTKFLFSCLLILKLFAYKILILYSLLSVLILILFLLYLLLFSTFSNSIYFIFQHGSIHQNNLILISSWTNYLIISWNKYDLGSDT